MDEISNEKLAAIRNFVFTNPINVAAQRSGSRLVQYESCREPDGTLAQDAAILVLVY
jgi:hypothetical protein